jgi:Tol biopolymer transport system component
MFSADQLQKKFSQPLDRAAIALIAVLTVAIALLLFGGDSTAPRVREFTWQNKQVSASDRAFIMTFSRPMDRQSVEDNLRIEPPVPGKISWAGRRMAYTVTQAVPYSREFKVELSQARERFAQPGREGTPIEPFVGEFTSRDRVLVYIGISPEERGQLILYNFSKREKTILTPKDLTVLDYRPYPDGDRLLFSAIDSFSPNRGILDQRLFTVTTGIVPETPGRWFVRRRDNSPGQIKRILGSDNYQNLSFDLSSDGKTILVQRVNKQDPGKSGLWKIEEGKQPKPLENQPGGDFMITPDSQTVAIAQGQGLAILPLEPKADPVDFLPQFARVLAFSSDGSAAAMVKFNTDYTRSLYLVTTTGVNKELLRIKGSFLSAQFGPQGNTLYCLLTKLVEGEVYKEEPYIAAIDLETGEMQPLVLLPDQREIHISLSPDGLGLLFDQIVSVAPQANQAPIDAVRTSSGEAIARSRLWLLPLDPSAPTNRPLDYKPEELPFEGLRPGWLP